MGAIKLTKDDLLSHLLRLWGKISSRRKRQLIFLLALMVASSLMEFISISTVLPFLLALSNPEGLFQNPIISQISKFLSISTSQDLIFGLTAVFVLAAFLAALIRLMALWFQTRIAHLIGSDLSIEIYEKTLYQPYVVHISRNSSEIISSIAGKTNLIVGRSILPSLLIINSVLMLLTILFGLLFIEPVFTGLVFFSFGLIYIVVMSLTRSMLHRDGIVISTQSNAVMKALQEGLGGIRDVLLSGSQKIYCKIYSEADIPLRRSLANIEFIGNSPRILIETLGISLIAIMAYLLSGGVTGGINSYIPVLGVLALGAQRVLPLLQLIYLSWVQLKGGEESLRGLLTLLDQPMPKYTQPQDSPAVYLKKCIALKNVCFKYSDDAKFSVVNVDLVIPKGSRIGFVGPSGSGKSTLIDIIMGLLAPQSGDFLVDNTRINSINCHAWQKNIAHVPQTIFLADSSIAENIAFGVPKESIDINRVKAAANKACLTKTIESLEGTYDAMVGERGIKLSGGQRQRIGVARALYTQATVLVLDEATSSLDLKTEDEVMMGLEDLDSELTVLIVAHRISTLRKCDKIIEVSNGTIKNIGSYNDYK
jgi:ABC-type multidrug transport system fused ATPase/permease subunit